MRLTPEDVAKLESAAVGQEYTFQISSALREAFGPDELPDFVGALILAFDYDEVRPGEQERRAEWGPFAPMIESAAGVYPPSISEIPAEQRNHWEVAAEALYAPIVRARLNDLLWQARHGSSPYHFALAAIDAYTELASGLEPGRLDKSDALSRALEIARQLSDSERIAQCVSNCVNAASEDLASADGAPGISIGLIESLAKLPKESRPPELRGLLDLARGRYEHDPWLTQNLVDIELSLGVSTARRTELVGMKMQSWETAADSAEGLIAATHLERALEIAQQNGLAGKADSLRLKLQSAGESIELQPLDATVEFEAAKIEAYIASFVEGFNLEQSLVKFAAHCPLPKSRDETADYVRTLMQQHPLQYLFTKVVLGPGNVPLQIVSTEAEHFRSAMTSHEAMTIEMWSLFAADVLDRIKETFDPTREEIREILLNHDLTQIVADRVAEAFELYWQGRHDAALLTALPRVETMIRDLSRRMELVIFVEPQAGKPGKFKGLGELLRGLAGHFDERRRHYLLAALADPMSYNLRNTALHGISLLGSREQAAIALHVNMIFSLFNLNSSENAEA